MSSTDPAETTPPEGHARQTLALPMLLATLVVAIDQLTKWNVTRELGPSEESHRSEILGDLLAIHYVENSGAAFGIFREQTVVLTVVAMLVVGVLIYSYRRAQNSTWQLGTGLGLLLGGAIGNLVDRVRLGYVVDFVAVSAWPKFNIADSAITAGVVLIAWHLLAHDAFDEANVARVGNAAFDRETTR